jgi:hypothetical protein
LKSRQVTLLALSLGILTVAGFLFARSREMARQSDDFPDGVFWVCLEPDCGAEFTTTIVQMADHVRAGGDPSHLPCPRCGKKHTSRAVRCPHCGRFYARPADYNQLKPCPYCHEPYQRPKRP